MSAGVRSASRLRPSFVGTASSWPGNGRSRGSGWAARRSTRSLRRSRNLYIEEEAPKVRFLIRDRHAKFARSFDEVFRTEGVHVIKTPIRAPNANAFAGRLIRTIRAEATDRALVLGPLHLDRLLRSFAAHYNAHQPHRGIDLQSPDTIGTVPEIARIADVRRRRVVGGLINEYRARAG